MDRRVNVPKSPFISRNLPIWVHVPLAQEKKYLLFREIRIDRSESHTMKCKVPRRIPGIFPLVRHRNDVFVVQVRPFVIAPIDPLSGWRWSGGIASKPLLEVIVIKL